MAEIVAAITVATTAGSLYSQQQANKAASRASAAQRRQEALSAAIQRRQQVKAGRQAQALAIQAGENQGVADSSGVRGGAGSAVSQSNSNLSFLDRQTQLADFAGGMFDRAQRWGDRAQMFNSASKLAGAAYGEISASAAATEAAKQQSDFYAMFNKGN